MIQIITYQQKWPEEFKKIGGSIRNALGELAVRIDHIGSTSVPNLVSKDVIDIQLTVQSFDPFLPIQNALESVEFEFMAEVKSDHRPSDHSLAGTFDYDLDWEKRYFKSASGQRRIHLHVRCAGRANQRYALLFRDYLRHHSQAASFYGEIKRCLAKYHANDTLAYVTIKDPVCDLIMHSAEIWATNTGWSPEPSDA